MKSVVVIAGMSLIAVMPLSAQKKTPRDARDTVVLTLPEAVARATTTSEEVQLARSQVDLADAQVRTVRSTILPQLSGNVGYTRTLASQFNTGGFSLPDSLKFEPDSLASLQERVRYLEKHAPTAGLGGIGSLFGDLPFGRENSYTATLNGSQSVYAGGRFGAALKTAKYFREAAQFQMSEQLADIELSVRRAYYHALLATELQQISVAAVEQADRFLTQERLRERSGAASELDVLRAEVASANLRPQLVQAQNAAALALLDLRRLVNLPADQALKLATPLEVPSAAQLSEEAVDSLTLLENRASIEAAERQVLMRELGVRIAKGAFLPSATLRTNYGRFLYPASVFDIGGIDWRTDWTVSLTVDVPIFDGLRRQAEVDQARVELRQSQLQLAQLREGVRLQYEQALGERRRAAADIAARTQTVNQAQRVHDLTVLRYERGLATQLEVSDARLALLQARTNLAQALTDYYVAQATVRRTLGQSDSVAR
jgi:outer membrane protein TolC